jgi:HAD superfamily hydrolase (TIGR01490 family)
VAKQVIAAFDFDGTITTKDTFLPFLVMAFGPWRVWLALGALAVPGLLVWIGQSTRDHFKALLIRKLFSGISVEFLNKAGIQHAVQIASLCRPAALNRIKWHKHQSHHLVMVSASLNFYLEPIAQQLGFEELLCTEVVSVDGICTGELKGENCRAAAKVRRLEALFGPLNQYEIYAYGDSDGDTEMLASADHPAFMPFHKSK